MPPVNSPVGEYTPVRSHITWLLLDNEYHQLTLDDPTQVPPENVSRTPSPSSLTFSFLPALRELNSSVLDLASTLTLQAEDEVEADNIRFLRSETPPPANPIAVDSVARELRTERRRIYPLRAQQNDSTSDHPSSHVSRTSPSDELGDSDARLAISRDTIDATRSMSSNQIPLSRYSSNIPAHQSLYDWAPGAEEDSGTDLEGVLAELRLRQPNAHPDIIQHRAEVQLAEGRHRAFTLRVRPARPPTQSTSNSSTPHEGSLRSQAAHNIRRNHRMGSNNTASAMHQYLLNGYQLSRSRNMTGRPEVGVSEPVSAVSPGSTTFRPHTSDAEYIRLPDTNLAFTSSNTPQERFKRDQAPDPSVVALQNTMLLLNKIRKAEDPLQEWRSWVKDTGWKETSIPDKTTVTRLAGGFPVPPSSWLFGGNVFSGCQHAVNTAGSATTMHRLVQSQASFADTGRESQLIRPQPSSDSQRPWLNQPMSQSPPPAFSSTRSDPVNNSSPADSHDRWTVKIVIHDVDYESGTVHGTMEAFNMPSNANASSCSTGTSAGGTSSEKTFSTFVVGEVVDLINHSFITESFPSSSKTDAMYWRRLDPFASMSDDEISAALTNPDWISNELQDKFVLMRWKEKCFVKETLSLASSWSRERRGNTHPAVDSTDSPVRLDRAPGCINEDGLEWGLSIKGFYYISLRRADGRIQGLYHDPESTPNQRLELRPMEERMTVGGIEFR